MVAAAATAVVVVVVVVLVDGAGKGEVGRDWRLCFSPVWLSIVCGSIS